LGGLRFEMKRKASSSNPPPRKRKCDVSYVRKGFPTPHPFQRAEQIYRPNKRKFPARVDEFSRIAQVGEGTYGQVFQAKILGGKGRDHVALKRVLMTEDKELPESFVREIKILHSLNHPNIVVLLDIVTNEQVSCVGKYQRDKLKLKDQDMMYKECVKNVAKRLESKYPKLKDLNTKHQDYVAHVRRSIPLETGDEDLNDDTITARQRFDEEVRNEFNRKISNELNCRRDTKSPAFFMVFEFLEHDLSGILNAPNLYLKEGEVKYIFQEIMHGVKYLHGVGVMHRDLKCANVLISKHGEVKLCDFNLSIFKEESINPNEYTNRAVTLWYRPPEIILGSTTYNETVDIWSAGIVLLEMLLSQAPFQGRTPLQQWKRICEKCGTPSEGNFPDAVKLPWYGKYMDHISHHPRVFSEFYKRRLQTESGSKDLAVDLADRLLQMDPKKRPSAIQILNDRWFNTAPFPKAKQFNFHSCHELKFRKRTVDRMKQQKYAFRKRETSSDEESSGSYDPTPASLSDGLPSAPF